MASVKQQVLFTLGFVFLNAGIIVSLFHIAWLAISLCTLSAVYFLLHFFTGEGGDSSGKKYFDGGRDSNGRASASNRGNRFDDTAKDGDQNSSAESGSNADGGND